VNVLLPGQVVTYSIKNSHLGDQLQNVKTRKMAVVLAEVFSASLESHISKQVFVLEIANCDNLVLVLDNIQGINRIRIL